MVETRFFIAVFTVTCIFSCFAAAGCSSNAYSQACSSCSFDSGGKMDQSCYSVRQAAGTACLTSTFPVAYAQYSAGNCSGIDECITELNSCKAQYSSGNDREDCREGSVGVCFSSADVCVSSAAAKCNPGAVSLCATPSAFILAGALAALGFASFTRG